MIAAFSSMTMSTSKILCSENWATCTLAWTRKDVISNILTFRQYPKVSRLILSTCDKLVFNVVLRKVCRQIQISFNCLVRNCNVKKYQLNAGQEWWKQKNCCVKVCLIFLYFSLSKLRTKLQHEVIKRISLFNTIQETDESK